VENNEEGQYLKVLEINEINRNAIEYLRKWSERMNTPIVYLSKLID
jgi:hypothetical protein